MLDGYYKNHRTYDILREIKFNDLFYHSLSSANHNMTDDARKQYYDMIQSYQPRRFPPMLSNMPEDLKKELKELSQQFEDDFYKRD